MKSNIPLLLTIALISPSVLRAQFTTPDKNPIEINPVPNDKPKPKPHDLSEPEIAQTIECSYSPGVISLTFSEPEGMAKVYIYDMSVVTALPAIHTINTATTARISVPTAPGFYRIAITTSLNNQYEGFYTVF